MAAVLIGCIGIITLITIIFLRVPIGMAMIAVGTAGFAAISGVDPALGILRGVPYETFVSPTYAVVILFVLMGNFAFQSGISDDLFKAVNTWIGKLKGGLALATIAACGGFAAISGSSVACAVTMGVVALPEMRKFKYSEALATGCIAAGGTLGILIPPSTIMILYGIITGESISKMFMAGVIPGLIQILLYAAVIRIWVTIRPQDGPAGEVHAVKEKIASLGQVWPIMLLFTVVIGGLYVGMFSPNEAAGIGACGAFFLGLMKKKHGRVKFIADCLKSSVATSGMCYLVVLGAMIFGYFLTVSRIPMELSAIIAGIVDSPILVILGILIVMIILGCFMDSMAIVLLTMPIFFPLIQQYGINPIWFGILVVRVTEIGLISPPVGLNLFVIKGVANVPMGSVFKGVIPFLAADFIHVAILMAFPILSLWLPSMMD
ncbi:MAG: TRAP transporter large permease [Mailhella sp.]|nr:TRAP transporter large permease [Mailhella sp.]